MKIFIYILVIITITTGCCQHENNKSMRRFTFAAFNKQVDTLVLSKISNDKNLKETLLANGVVNYNYCFMDSVSYFILDMDQSFDLKLSQELFEKLSESYPDLNNICSIINGEYELLDRIYKLEQKIAYNANEGQLIPYQHEQFARFVLTLEIVNNPQLAEEYIKVHAIGKAWPEITQNMKTVGIHEMELYLLGYRAFLIMDTKPEFDWATDGELWGTLPHEKEWQSYVAKFQKTDPESKAAEKWKTMNAISLDDK